jgi:hypothetical protein
MAFSFLWAERLHTFPALCIYQIISFSCISHYIFTFFLLPIGRHWHVTLPHLQFQCLIKIKTSKQAIAKIPYYNSVVKFIDFISI